MSSIETMKSEMAELQRAIESRSREVEIVRRWLDELDYDIKSSWEYTIGCGKEEEQAKDCDGNLLYNVEGSWKHYTMDKLPEDVDMEKVTPYHRDIYETRTYDSIDELNSWALAKYDSSTNLKKMLLAFCKKDWDMTEQEIKEA